MGERVKQGPLSKSINQCSDCTNSRPPSHGPRIRRDAFDADDPHFPEGQIDHSASFRGKSQIGLFRCTGSMPLIGKNERHEGNGLLAADWYPALFTMVAL